MRRRLTAGHCHRYVCGFEVEQAAEVPVLVVEQTNVVLNGSNVPRLLSVLYIFAENETTGS